METDTSIFVIIIMILKLDDHVGDDGREDRHHSLNFELFNHVQEFVSSLKNSPFSHLASFTNCGNDDSRDPHLLSFSLSLSSKICSWFFVPKKNSKWIDGLWCHKKEVTLSYFRLVSFLSDILRAKKLLRKIIFKSKRNEV